MNWRSNWEEREGGRNREGEGNFEFGVGFPNFQSEKMNFRFSFSLSKFWFKSGRILKWRVDKFLNFRENLARENSNLALRFAASASQIYRVGSCFEADFILNSTLM